jgi:hypothetical protein
MLAAKLDKRINLKCLSYNFKFFLSILLFSPELKEFYLWLKLKLFSIIIDFEKFSFCTTLFWLSNS